MRERLGTLGHLESHFTMFDLKPWSSKPDEEYNRRKNFDRWWYCVDVLLWMSGATSWSVRRVVERDFSIEAEIDLIISPSGWVSAKFSMTRDQLWPLLDWSFSAEGSNGTVALSNVGFPWVYHTVTSVIGAAGSRQRSQDQFYGERLTTFEYQLEAFLVAVRGGAGAAAEPALLTAHLVDDLLRSAGGDRQPFPSSSALVSAQ